MEKLVVNVNMDSSNLKSNIEDSVNALMQQGLTGADVGVIFGTGLAEGFKDTLSDVKEISFAKISHVPSLKQEGHPGIFSWGKLNNTCIVSLHGRLHCYEGYSAAEVAHPVRMLQKLGVKILIITNIAGGLNPGFREGDLMTITDHINLMGISPLVGSNDASLGPQFPDMSRPYTKAFAEKIESIGFQEGISMREGVYAGVLGPQLETRAEYRFLRSIGADAVGMSTIPEVIAAVHAGMDILGLSLITDLCVPETLKPVDIPKILRIAKEAEPRLIKLISKFLEHITSESAPQTADD